MISEYLSIKVTIRHLHYVTTKIKEGESGG